MIEKRTKKRMFVSLVFLVLMVVSIVYNLQPVKAFSTSTIEFHVIEDAYVDFRHPDKNYGENDLLLNEFTTIFIKFDKDEPWSWSDYPNWPAKNTLAKVSEYMNIISAKLCLKVYDSWGETDINIYAVKLEEFSENEITYNNAPKEFNKTIGSYIITPGRTEISIDIDLILQDYMIVIQYELGSSAIISSRESSVTRSRPILSLECVYIDFYHNYVVALGETMEIKLRRFEPPQYGGLTKLEYSIDSEKWVEVDSREGGKDEIYFYWTASELGSYFFRVRWVGTEKGKNYNLYSLVKGTSVVLPEEEKEGPADISPEFPLGVIFFILIIIVLVVLSVHAIGKKPKQVGKRT